MFKFIFLILIIYYIISYCCIYTAIITYHITKPFNPEYRKIDMNTINHNYHAYVHVFGLDLFLNPFREYGEYTIIKTHEEYMNNIKSQFGEIYIPILNKSIKII